MLPAARARSRLALGKAYAKELAVLGETYAWAREAPVEPLEEFVTESHARPLLAIGSGGSATAAHLAALLHGFHGGAFARHATPLDVLLRDQNLWDAAILILSASGRNRDVLAVLNRCMQCDARAVATLCTQRGSPLAIAARRFERTYVFEDDVPSGKDGFLATNSLLATCIFIARAYGAKLPERLPIEGAKWRVPDGDGRHTVLVLHGGWGSPVATDLESKLNESAIACAHVSDYRNFGHGRHLWLARRGCETIIVALVSPETFGVAERTCARRTRVKQTTLCSSTAICFSTSYAWNHETSSTHQNQTRSRFIGRSSGLCATTDVHWHP